MHRIDKLHTAFPFAGSRMLRGLLAQEGLAVGRLHVATLMRRTPAIVEALLHDLGGGAGKRARIRANAADLVRFTGNP